MNKKSKQKSKLILSVFFLITGLQVGYSTHGSDTPTTCPKKSPNIIFILADDAGIGDFSAYGCKYGVTPYIDHMASEGMRFTQAYSGNAVCAPSRCVLMTGLHPGHGLIRANENKERKPLSLHPDQVTVARVLKEAGYVTGGFGKWGLGNPGTMGIPEKEGFDEFFGYYDQVHAHNYFTDHLLSNSCTVPIRQSGKKSWKDYSHTRIADETIAFIERNKDRPFFCYAAWTPPHGDYEIPDSTPYSARPWDQMVRNYAAMVGLIDRDVGRVLRKLKELGIDDRTIVIFSSDNGANKELIAPLGSTGGLRGYKRLLYEGGIRAPFIVRWPGHIPGGTTNDTCTSFVDFLPTAADLAGVSIPAGIDGISLLPVMLGKKSKLSRESLYFEICEPYFQQAVRWGDWKGYRLGTNAPMELYNLKNDPSESCNLGASHPDIVQKISSIMEAEHTPSPHYVIPAQPLPKKQKKKNETPAMLDRLLNEEKPDR